MSVQLKNPKDRELLLKEISLMGHTPRIKGETVTVVINDHFKGSFISLIGTMDGYEISQEERESETQNGSQFIDGDGI